jgi:hypothetical protein
MTQRAFYHVGSASAFPFAVAKVDNSANSTLRGGAGATFHFTGCGRGEGGKFHSKVRQAVQIEPGLQ